MIALNRRMFVFSGIALAGCQTTGVSVDSSRVLTNKYDGEYNIAVGRTHNRTPANARDPLSYENKYDSLAFLRVRVDDGRFFLIRADESVPGTGYTDFSGYFYSGGLMEISTTAGYMYGKRNLYNLKVNADIGDALISGEKVVIRPNGFNADYTAHLEISKVG